MSRPRSVGANLAPGVSYGPNPPRVGHPDMSRPSAPLPRTDAPAQSSILPVKSREDTFATDVIPRRFWGIYVASAASLILLQSSFYLYFASTEVGKCAGCGATKALLSTLRQLGPVALLGPAAIFLPSRLQGRVTRRVAMGILVTGVLSLLYCGIRTLLAAITNPQVPVTVLFHRVFLLSFSASFLLFANLAALGLAAKYFRASRAQLAAEANLRELLRGRYLSALIGQIRPHFLFNALNSACALLASDRRRVGRMLNGIREFLSNVTAHEGSHFVTLREELRTLAIYLELEAANCDNRLGWTFDIPPELMEIPVPLMILQPLTENAIRHGMPLNGGPLCLTISGKLNGEGKLLLEVVNTGAGTATGGSSHGGMGIGIGNTRSRLAILYGGAGAFHLERNSGGGSISMLTLPTSEPQSVGKQGSNRSGRVSADNENVSIPSAAERPALWGAFTVFWILDGAFSSYVAHELGPPGWRSLTFSGLAEAVSWGTTTLGAYWTAFRIRPTLAAIPRIGAALLGLYVWQQATNVALLWPLRNGWSPFVDQLQAFPTNMTYIAVAVGVGYGIRYCILVRQREPVLQELWLRSRDAEIRRLRTELDPSFLIAALDQAISRLHSQPEEADRQIIRMGDFLHLALARSQNRCISLQEEIEFVRQYDRIGTGGTSLDMMIEADPRVLSREVPRLVLLPLMQPVFRNRSTSPLKLIARMLGKHTLLLQVKHVAPWNPSLARDAVSIAEVLNRVADPSIAYSVDVERRTGDFLMEIRVNLGQA
jgi:LytS/YehU family sensor histidine kinase